MAAAATDYFTEVGNPGTATTLSAPGHTIAGTTFNVVSTSNWPTTTGAIFAVDTFTTQIVNGVSTAVRDPGSYTEWEGVVASATQITGATLRYGTDQNYSAGSATRVYIPVASSRENRLVQGILSAGLTQAGGMGAITPTSIVSSGTVTATNFIQSGGAGASGWTVGLTVPNTVTALGNRSYSLVVNSTDLTGIVSAGMRLRTTRTVAAPTQCADLESSSSQYFSKTTPTGITFTDDFTCMGWVKLESYGADMGIIARRNVDTEGWSFKINSFGQVAMTSLRIAGNNSEVKSYQSIPLGKWVHVAASSDLSGTSNLVYIDGVLAPSLTTVTGTITAIVQGTTALVVGAEKSAGTNPFDGKIAQAAVFSSVLSAATILSYMSQTLSGAESTNVSVFSLNNTLNDLNANANNLTAQGSALATNADSPFGGQADGTISSTLDYAIITKTAFSTNTTLTVQVPEGCTIPTTGGVSAVSYSTQKAPYLFPSGFDTNGMILSYIPLIATQTTTATSATQFLGATTTFTAPSWCKRILIKAYNVSFGSSANTPVLTFWSGTVGSGTQIYQQNHTAASSMAINAGGYYDVIPGNTYTINMGFNASGAATTTWSGNNATFGNYFSVEVAQN